MSSERLGEKLSQGKDWTPAIFQAYNRKGRETRPAEGGDIWFALDETRSLACFAGIWTNWTSVRKVKEGETTNDLYAFLTTVVVAAEFALFGTRARTRCFAIVCHYRARMFA